jgi:glyoxylase-like metal-dependent hydrolase (beta-lactamase superfamily II)
MTVSLVFNSCIGMTIKSFTFNPFMTYCYICHDGGEAVVIDPSCHTQKEYEAVLGYLDRHGLSVRHLLLTHAHIDHVFGCRFISDHFGRGFRMHRSDVPLLENARAQAQLFGVSLDAPPVPRDFLDEGDTVSFGAASWEVLHTPGHSPGSICFYDAENGFVVAGDVLFQGSIGRTDLWQGSLPTLMQSIFQKLVPLGDDVKVYPGHGPSTTIGRERQANPFLTAERPL